MEEKRISEDEYEMPELDKVKIDSDKKEVNIVKNDPYEKLVTIYKERRKVDLLKPNKNCKKNGCYGRGYIGIDNDTKEPIACVCVLPKDFKEKNKDRVILNNRIKRKMYQENKHNIKRMLKETNNKLELDSKEGKDIKNVPNMDLGALQMTPDKIEELKTDDRVVQLSGENV